MTEVARTTRFLLTERSNNPHSRVRANGVRGWFYPSRNGGTAAIRTIGIHTTEGGRALATARWQATDAPDPSSYHVIVEAEGLVRTLDDEAVAFHIAGHNTPSLGLSFAGRAADWGHNPTRDRRALEHAARQAAAWAAAYNIPLRWLSKSLADRGARGFVRHSTMDPSRRRDPGDRFPADLFFRLIDQEATLMALDPEDIDKIAEAVARRVWREDIAGTTAQTLLNQTHHAARLVAASVDGRKVGDDLVRLRNTARAHAQADGVEADPSEGRWA